MPCRLSFALCALTLLGSALGAPPARAKDAPADPFLWLEEVLGDKALAWVNAQNAATTKELQAHPAVAEIEAHALAVLEADDRLVYGERHGDWIYNFWRDAEHPRGLYRRAPVAGYLAGTPTWDVLLDVDALAQQEAMNWVWKRIVLRHPDYERGLVRLSVGGSDAAVVREFDILHKRFVNGGFELPEAKSDVSWIDADTLFVGTDFGPGSMTDSGYPRIAKRWRRGTPLAEAEVVFEGRQEAVSVDASREFYGATSIDWISNGTSFYTQESYVLDGKEKVRLALPPTARIHTYFEGLLFLELKEDWKVGERTYARGALLTIPLEDLKAGKTNFDLFLQPDETMSLQGVERTKSYLVVSLMQDVRDHLYRYERKDGAWVRQELAFEGMGSIGTSSIDADRDDFFVTYNSYLSPTTLYHVDAGSLAKKVVQQEPARFDAKPYTAEQMFATSKDGTRVPYFVVMRKDLERNGRNRTLLTGYGGFRIPLTPWYMGSLGKNWLERGGVYVVANIRGGGEYGPRWHQAALKENRHKAFEDFEAIAEDLIAKKITSSKHLGIQGGSNGGLLVGATFTRRPELYGAVVCQVPLLDMRRYNKLLAGASWMAEYGDPDVPEEWDWLKTYSPYQNLSASAKYPRVLFTTSTRDDRVHPGHARKMVARMLAMGHPVLYYENTEGGHAGAANARQRAFAAALTLTYLLTELGG